MKLTNEMRLRIALRDLLRAVQGGDWVDIDNATEFAEKVLEESENDDPDT